MQKWEYKMIRGWLGEDELNLLGAEGWELVAVMAFGNANNHEIRAYLKRLISN